MFFLPCTSLKELTDFRKTWKDCTNIEVLPKVVFLKYLQMWITTWQTYEFLGEFRSWDLFKWSYYLIEWSYNIYYFTEMYQVTIKSSCTPVRSYLYVPLPSQHKFLFPHVSLLSYTHWYQLFWSPTKKMIKIINQDSYLLHRDFLATL